MKNIKLLDCTLRDGGYYNRWDFSENLITNYLDCMKKCSVDYKELGFRTLKNVGFKGPCAYTKNNFINSVVKFSNPKIGVMINGSEILDNYQYSYILYLNSFSLKTNYDVSFIETFFLLYFYIKKRKNF